MACPIHAAYGKENISVHRKTFFSSVSFSDGTLTNICSVKQTRLESFINGWVSEHMQPADLAAVGFYWTGQIDCGRCFECRTEICRWEAGDDAMTKHRRWGGRCRSVHSLSCIDVPIGTDPITIHYVLPPIHDVTGPFRFLSRGRNRRGVAVERLPTPRNWPTTPTLTHPIAAKTSWLSPPNEWRWKAKRPADNWQLKTARECWGIERWR